MTESTMLMTALAGAGDAYTSYSAGQANRAIDRFDAKQATIQANQALESGATQQADTDIKSRILQGEQASAFAGQGVLAHAGTARAVMAGSEAVSEMDKLMLGVNSRRAAFGYQTRAAEYRFMGDQAAVRGNEGALAALGKAGISMGKDYRERHPFDADSETGTKSLLSDESIYGEYGAGAGDVPRTDYSSGMTLS